jgi:hypothetical protein
MEFRSAEHAGLTPLEWELLEACRAQHRAIDLLLALLLQADPAFRPSQSAAWPAVEQAWALISKLGDARVKELFGRYTDETFAARPCDRCGRLYRGPAVYCSLVCAQADA